MKNLKKKIALVLSSAMIISIAPKFSASTYADVLKSVVNVYDSLLTKYSDYEFNDDVQSEEDGKEYIDEGIICLNKWEYSYTGSKIIPKFTVEFGNKILEHNKDYTFTIEDNINVGTATIIVEGIGNYEGILEDCFEIVKATNNLDVGKTTYTKKASSSSQQKFKINAHATSGDKSITFKSNNNSVKVDNSGNVTILKNYSGKAIIKVTAGNSNYKTVYKSVIINVNKNTNRVTTLKNTYVRKASTKDQTFLLNVKANSGASSINYKSDSKYVRVNQKGIVTVSKNFAGRATITITAGNNVFNKVTKKIVVEVKPSSVKVTSLQNITKNSIRLKWNRVVSATGYEIQYSEKSNFKGAKTVSVTKSSNVSKSITKLSKGKKYYVRIRSYKLIGKTKLYSNWSNARSIKITK